jgi:phosphoglycerate dehydrogenase-like enzyme
MGTLFEVGVPPDFYRDAQGRFERVLEEKLSLPHLRWGRMEALEDNLAAPANLDRYDAVFALALRISRESLIGVKRLAHVSRWGVGYDKIDVTALTESDVMLSITPSAVRTPVAEAVLTLILALAKNLFLQDRLARSGKWRGDLPRMGRNLRGQVLGSIGCGNIAQEVFRLAQPFGFARRIAYDPFLLIPPPGVELASLEEVLRSSDYLAINCLLNEQTRGMIGTREFRLMKPTACLVNTARGPIVDEAALLEALRENWIAGAGLDVFEKEPLPRDHPLLGMENVIITPHGLPWTEELARDNSLEACENILAVARGELPGGIVNPEVISKPGFQAKLARYRGN